MSRRRFVVALHELDRAYGGPEEGGWHFDTNVPSTEPEHRRFLRVFRSKAKASRYRDRLWDQARKASEGTRDVGSAIYAGGQYGAVMQRGEQPQPYPLRRPRYE
ncbi:MAG: hypothetical protein DDT25_00011 [Chloroflexi bacterium]|nr:hypothetical protein [Chloroflexota bacterium]